MQQAQQVAGRRDIRIVGGAQVIQQYINTGLVDEFTIHYAPLFLGQGIRLFDKIDKNRFSVQINEDSSFSSRHTLAIQGNTKVSKSNDEELAFVFLV